MLKGNAILGSCSWMRHIAESLREHNLERDWLDAEVMRNQKKEDWSKVVSGTVVGQRGCLPYVLCAIGVVACLRSRVPFVDQLSRGSTGVVGAANRPSILGD